MVFIRTIPPEQATGKLKELYDVTGWLKMYEHRRLENGIDKPGRKGVVSLPQPPADDAPIGSL